MFAWFGGVSSHVFEIIQVYFCNVVTPKAGVVSREMVCMTQGSFSTLMCLSR